ncbi:MAG: hypothetical protein J5929_03810 [Eubacterium sp.]|nr:hypothetical protein [Eubacterium sp.]
MKKISEKEKSNLKRKTYNELLRLENIINNTDDISKINLFKNYFNVCESVYKVVLKRLTDKKDKDLKLDMREIPAAMKYAGYIVDINLLKRLFGSKKLNGKNTAKLLRNSVTHGINERAVIEILERWNELFDDMNDFLNLVRMQ